MTQAVLTPRSPWIVGPRYDLLFFSTIWLLPLLVLAPIGAAGIGLGAAFFYVWIYHLLIRLPHFVVTFRVTYFLPEQRAYYREHWVLYFAVPACILLAYGLPLTGGQGYSSPVGQLLVLLAYCWGYQHIGMQNYGILQIYRMRTGSTQNRIPPRFERTIFYTVIVAVVATNHLVPFLEYSGRTALADGTKDALVWGPAGALVLLLAVYTAYLRRSGNGLSWPAMLYFGVSLLAMIQWPFYENLPKGSWFLVFNGHHGVAYLGLLYVMDWNRKNPGEPMTFARGFREYLNFMLPMVGFSLLLVLVTALYGAARFTVGYDGSEGGSLEILMGFIVMHYYVDSLVWKFRRAHNRRTTLPLLRRPG